MSVKPSTNSYEVTSCFSKNWASLKWSIKNFSLCSLKEGEKFRSPVFSSADATWVLDVFPKSSAQVGKVAIYLSRISSEFEESTVSYKIGLQDKNGVDHCVHESRHVFNGSLSGWAGTSLIGREILMNEKKSELLPDDTLTVFCELNAGCSLSHSSVTRIQEKSDEPSPPTIENSRKKNSCAYKLISDFTVLFQNPKHCDVTLISSDGFKFLSHKAILGARSSVFSAMFHHDMTENRCGQVHIEDIDGFVLKDLLHYIYCGRIENISACDFRGLFAAADKYHVVTLKERCIQHMVSNISIDNVCDAICLTSIFKEKKLKDSAVSFLCKNASQVFSSDFWKVFVQEHSHLAAEILKDIVLNEKT